MVKAVKLLNVFSVIIFLAVFLWIYAYMPVTVRVFPGEDAWVVGKEYFFYAGLVIFIVVNICLYFIFRRLATKISNELLLAWLSGFTFIVNLFLAFLVGFLGVYNNSLHVDPAKFVYLNFLGPAMVLSWLVGLIFFVKWKA